MVMRGCPRSFRVRAPGLLLACLVVGGLVGCGGGEQREEGATLIVLAASSLTDAFGKLESVFEEQNEGVYVQTSFAGSSELLAQVQQAAPADVFASADEAKMDTVLGEGLATEAGNLCEEPAR